MAKKKKGGLLKKIANFFLEKTNAPSTYEVYSTIGRSEKLVKELEYELTKIERRNKEIKEINRLINIRLIINKSNKVVVPLDTRITEILTKLN
jgi:hypothetical protein